MILLQLLLQVQVAVIPSARGLASGFRSRRCRWSLGSH
ncbi:hypothetical protein LINPERPRIM_LOCUS1192 [Linum perenne]